jgi:hypothetical protein
MAHGGRNVIREFLAAGDGKGRRGGDYHDVVFSSPNFIWIKKSGKIKFTTKLA